MSTEKYIGEAAMKGSPKVKLNLNLRESSVTTEKLADGSVTTPKIADGNVTNQKMAINTLTIDKFDPELRKVLQAATGLPEEFIEMIQDVDKSLDKLNDTVYPITLGFSLSPNVGTMQTDIAYSITSDGKAFVPDTLSIIKRVDDTDAKTIVDTPASSGSATSKIEGSRETFTFTVGKSGRTGKSTSQTRYLCYYGGNAAANATASLLDSLSKVSSTSVSFNPTVNTKDKDYIWLVVPKYLNISRVTSAGFDVTLSTVQTVTTSMGTFKAYRTANSLTTNKWNLVIS